MTFRHPLRNEWDRHKAAFTAAAAGNDGRAAMARLMLDMMPPFLAALERERDLGTTNDQLRHALAAVAGCIIENAVEHAPALMSPRAALHGMLSLIERTTLPRLVGKPGGRAGLILPGDA